MILSVVIFPEIEMLCEWLCQGGHAGLRPYSSEAMILKLQYNFQSNLADEPKKNHSMNNFGLLGLFI